MQGEAAALGAAFCWAVASHLFARIGRGGLPAGAMNLARCATAALLFAASVLLLHGRLIPGAAPGDLAWLATSGFVGLSLGDTAFYGALVALGARRALLAVSTAPVFATVGGVLFLGEPLSPGELVAISAVLAGLVIVIAERTPSAPVAAPGSVRRGLALGLFAGAAQAAGGLMSRHGMRHGIDALDTSLVRMVAALAGLIVVAALAGRLGPWLGALGGGDARAGEARRSPLRTLAAIAGAATIGTFVGVGLAQHAFGHASSAAVATTLLATSPLFALPLAHFIFAERVTLRAVGGTVIACAGVVMLTLR